jgi:hypothetical protein
MAHLTKTQRKRVEQMMVGVNEGLTQSATAKLAGVTAPALIALRLRLTGGAGWPPPRAELEALLALPVVDDQPSNLPDWRLQEREGYRGTRWAKSGVISEPRLPDEEIARRQDANIAARRAHEEHWLAVEQERYGLARRGRALSDMVA